MTAWEYRVLSWKAGGGVLPREVEDELNDLGAEGWEAVNCAVTDSMAGAILLKRAYALDVAGQDPDMSDARRRLDAISKHQQGRQQ